jgi:hypothetical protein
VVRGEPDAVSRRRLLSAEEQFATVQPVQRIDGTVVGGELQLAEARNAQPLECAAAGAAERGLLVGAVGVGGPPAALPVLRPVTDGLGRSVKRGGCVGEWGNRIFVIGFGADVPWGIVVDGVEVGGMPP